MFLKLLLIAVVVYLALKAVKGLFLRYAVSSRKVNREGEKGAKGYYDSITDQEIEDAEFEEVDPEKDK